MVAPKVREKISNLKPGTLGYKTACERLQKEYGQTKLVVNAHMDEIINLTPVKGNSFEKVREFYEVLSKNYDALQTLGEADMLRGFMTTMLKKLPQVKPDLVRVDNHWEEGSMKELIENLQKWLKRNKVDDSSTDAGTRKKGNGTGIQGERGTPAMNPNPLLAYTVKVTTGGKPVESSIPQKKEEISFLKGDCVTTVDVRVKGRVTAEVALVSSVSQDTTQARVTDIW